MRADPMKALRSVEGEAQRSTVQAVSDEGTAAFEAERPPSVAERQLVQLEALANRGAQARVTAQHRQMLDASPRAQSPIVQREAVVQMGRRKEFKNERQRLSTEKRMGPVWSSMEQAEEERAEEERREAERAETERREAEEAAAYEARFDRYLREGMDLILGEEYGGVGDGIRFGAFADAFDKKYWKLEELPNEEESGEEEEEEEEVDYELVLKDGVKPSDGIDFLFSHLDKWALDCAESIQVARWYAMRHAMGADEFNETVGDLKFGLKSHESTLLGSRGQFARIDKDGFYDPEAALKFTPDGSSKSKAVKSTPEAIVERAPVGTRVLLTCTDDNAVGTDFENENVIKVGPDRYAAHPLGAGTLDHIIEEVAKTALDFDEQTEIGPEQLEAIKEMRKKIYISEIELIKKR